MAQPTHDLRRMYVRSSVCHPLHYMLCCLSRHTVGLCWPDTASSTPRLVVGVVRNHLVPSCLVGSYRASMRVWSAVSMAMSLLWPLMAPASQGGSCDRIGCQIQKWVAAHFMITQLAHTPVRGVAWRGVVWCRCSLSNLALAQGDA